MMSRPAWVQAARLLVMAAWLSLIPCLPAEASAGTAQEAAASAFEKLRGCLVHPALMDSLVIELPRTGLSGEQWTAAADLYRQLMGTGRRPSRRFLEDYARFLSDLLLNCRAKTALVKAVEDTPWKVFSPEQRGMIEEAFKKALWAHEHDPILLLERARYFGQRKPEDIARFDAYSKDNLKKVLALKERTDQGAISADIRRARNLAMTMFKQYDLQLAGYEQDPGPAAQAAAQIREYIWRCATLNTAPPYALTDPEVEYEKQFDSEKWSLATFLGQGDASAGEVLKTYARALYLSYHLPGKSLPEAKKLQAQVALECMQQVAKAEPGDPWAALLLGLFEVDNQRNPDDVVRTLKRGIQGLPPASSDRSVFLDPDTYFGERDAVPGLSADTSQELLAGATSPETPVVSYWIGLLRVQLVYGDYFSGARGWDSALGRTLVRNPDKVVVPELAGFADSTTVRGGTPQDQRMGRPPDRTRVLPYTPNQVSVYDKDDPNKTPEVFVDVSQGRNRWGAAVTGGMTKTQWDQALVHGDFMHQIERGATAYQAEAEALTKRPYLLFVYPVCSRGEHARNPRTELVLAVFRPKRSEKDDEGDDWWKGKSIDIRAVRLAQDGTQLEEKVVRQAMFHDEDVHALGEVGDLLLLEEATESLSPGAWDIRASIVDPHTDKTVRPGGRRIYVRGIAGAGLQLSDSRLFLPRPRQGEGAHGAEPPGTDLPNFLQRVTTQDRLDFEYDIYSLTGEPDSVDFGTAYAIQRAWPFFAVLDPIVSGKMTKGQEEIYSALDSTMFLRSKLGQSLRLDALARWMRAFIAAGVDVEYKGHSRALVEEDNLSPVLTRARYDEIQILPPRLSGSADSTKFALAEKGSFLPHPYRTVRASIHIGELDLAGGAPDGDAEPDSLGNRAGGTRGLPSGDYVLLAQTTDRRSGQAVVQVTPFTVVPPGELFPRPGEPTSFGAADHTP